MPVTVTSEPNVRAVSVGAAVSVEYTTLKSGNRSLRTILRIFAANGQTVVFDIFAILICVTSVLRAAPMLDTNGMSRETHHLYSAILDGTVSIASITKSGATSNAVASSKNNFIGVTWIAGFISRIRAAATSTLANPIVDCKAINWRFILDSSITSESIIMILPTPVRAPR